MAEADFRLLVVWTNTFLTDGEAGARAATALFDDPRVAQFHDPERHVGRALADKVGMPSLTAVAAAKGQSPEDLGGRFRDGYLHGEASVFDTMLFFPPGVEWKDEPPEPAGWVTQLDPALFLLDASRFRFGEAMGDEMARLAAILLRKDVPAPAVRRVSRVSDAAPRGASCDLVLCDGRLVAAHPEADGAVRVLGSSDGESFEPSARIALGGVALADPRLAVTPDGRLLLTCAGPERETLTAVSVDGSAFGPLEPAVGLPPGSGSFRLAWHAGTGYCMPNPPDTGSGAIGLHRTRDGRVFEPVLPDLGLGRGACEASLAFDPDGTLHAVLRDAPEATRAWLVRSEPPYEALEVRRLEHGLAGPHLVRLHDGRFLVATRDPAQDRFTILRVERDGSFERLQSVEAEGSVAGPSMVAGDGALWIQYVAADGEGAAVYLARAILAE